MMIAPPEVAQPFYQSPVFWVAIIGFPSAFLASLAMWRSSKKVENKVDAVQEQVVPKHEIEEDTGPTLVAMVHELGKDLIDMARMIGAVQSDVGQVKSDVRQGREEVKRANMSAAAAAEAAQDLRSLVTEHRKLPTPNGHPKAPPKKRPKRRPKR